MGKDIDTITSKIRLHKNNFIINISDQEQEIIIEKMKEKIVKEENSFVIILDGKEISKIALNIEESFSKYPKELSKIDLSPSKIEFDLINLKKLLRYSIYEEGIDEKRRNIMMIEKDFSSNNFQSTKKFLFELFLMHYLFDKAKKENPNLVEKESKEIRNVCEVFNQKQVDIIPIMRELDIRLYNLDNLLDILKNENSNEKYIYILKNGEYIFDFTLQEQINFLMFNIRNKYFSFNYFSQFDTLTNCGRFSLENGNDVEFITSYSKAYKKN
ncbi:MAG: hypothetical protein PHQ64_04315 [Bacilli bacterium]|nr:hypothetical protein [Bacilli bacterium]